MDELTGLVDAQIGAQIDGTGFSGVVCIARGDDVVYERAHGEADRAHGIANALDTQFGTASLVKGFTALTVMSLVEDGALSLDTRVRDVLAQDELELVDPTVTVEHLLGHTSGIGDFLDEDELDNATDYVLAVPVHTLASTSDYLSVLGGHEQKFAPGARFSYCNGGYVLLALVIEALTGASYYDVVAERVFVPAAMHATAFLRSDQLPGSAALGYLPADDPPGWRTNQLHLPVRGSGDGGAYTTLSDMSAFWTALHAGALVPLDVVDAMTRPRIPAPEGASRYGLGFWLRADRSLVWLEGNDAGVSCWSAHLPASQLTCTVLSNTSDDAWPVVRAIEAALDQ